MKSNRLLSLSMIAAVIAVALAPNAMAQNVDKNQPGKHVSCTGADNLAEAKLIKTTKNGNGTVHYVVESTGNQLHGNLNTAKPSSDLESKILGLKDGDHFCYEK